MFLLLSMCCPLQLPWFMDWHLGSYSILLFTAWDLLLTVTATAGYCFYTLAHPSFILSGIILHLISNAVGTLQPRSSLSSNPYHFCLSYRVNQCNKNDFFKTYISISVIFQCCHLGDYITTTKTCFCEETGSKWQARQQQNQMSDKLKKENKDQIINIE